MKSRMVLMIVALVVLASLLVVPAVSAAPLPGSHDGHEGGVCSYRVRYGDTMSKIAYRYDTSVWELKELNRRVHNVNCIYAGEWLTVPCGEEEHKSCGHGCNSYKPVYYPKQGCGFNCAKPKPVHYSYDN